MIPAMRGGEQHGILRRFKLSKPARSKGGDRYESAPFGPDNQIMVIYIPQQISRPNGTALETIKVTFEGDE